MYVKLLKYMYIKRLFERLRITLVTYDQFCVEMQDVIENQ